MGYFSKIKYKLQEFFWHVMFSVVIALEAISNEMCKKINLEKVTRQKPSLKNRTLFHLICGVYPKRIVRALSCLVCLSMASSISTYHQHHLLSPSFSSKISASSNRLSSPFLTSSSSGLSSKFNFSLRFLTNGQSSSLISPTPRRLSVVSMAPPKAKPGGKAKKGIFFLFFFGDKPLISFNIILKWAAILSNLLLGVCSNWDDKACFGGWKGYPSSSCRPCSWFQGC